MIRSIKLSKWAELHGYTYNGAFICYQKGGIAGAYKLASGAIMVPDIDPMEQTKTQTNTIIYARVSSPKQRPDLQTQADRISQFCSASGWVVNKIYKEVASGLNDDRRLLNKILDDKSITRIVVEHKDRLTRFGFGYIKRLLEQRGCEVVVINEAQTNKEDIMQDFVSVITSMCSRLYGMRRCGRRTEILIQEMQKINAQEEQESGIDKS